MGKAFSEAPPPCNCKRRHRISSWKCSLYIISVLALLFIILSHIHMTTYTSWHFMHQLHNTFIAAKTNTKADLELEFKLRESVTFLPLKDLRYSTKPQQGHTWFMSSTLDTQEKGEVQHQEFPSKGRILCLKGRDTHDGSWNSYALAWPHALPPNTTLLKGLTFISYNHYSYDNIWHGLSAIVPFVAWHIKNQCLAAPQRWVLYHWGELRTKMGPWLSSLMEATFAEPLNIEKFEGGDGACFDKAVVMRHNEGGLSKERRLQVYDLLRCKARSFCNVSLEKKGIPVIGMTLFMRTGARSFKNETVVVEIFSRACRTAEGCRLIVAYANNLTFCEQVKLMSQTDILVSPHGAQLSNMFLMERNSSIMEFFPKGWLNLAGIGQYVYHWIASWSGMNHRGAWRDPDGDTCPYPEDDRRCMAIFKNSRIGHNQSYFYEWATNVVSDVKLRKAEQIANKTKFSVSSSCVCHLS
ncbi:hypothetical protein ACS0TY_002945 [Phlomoides rotata]